MSFTEANTVESIQYHTPDTRWEIIGGNDFESYSDKFVVKGLFHKCVPEAIVESYEVAEYIMAHSWYHYPMYDEALSKLLRITELAIKLRCAELNIPITFTNKQNKEQKKTLSQLIDALSRHEPEKDLKDQLHRIRSVRNIFMHPERHSYGLGIISNVVKEIVNVLNTIFLLDQLFAKVKAQINKLQNHIDQFHGKPLVLTYKGKRYLVETIKVREAICLNDNWQYCLVATPVITNLTEQLYKHSFTLPLMYEGNSITFNTNGFSAKELSTGLPLEIGQTQHPENLITYGNYLDEKTQAKDSDLWFYNSAQDREGVKMGTEFLYKYQHLIP
jgi:hypothetical protein